MKERSYLEQGLNVDRVLHEIDKMGNSHDWGKAFKTFLDLKGRVERGEICNFTDVPRARGFHMVFENYFGKDADMVLNEWRQAQDRQRFKRKNKLHLPL